MKSGLGCAGAARTNGLGRAIVTVILLGSPFQAQAQGNRDEVVLTLRTSVPATGVSVHYPNGGGAPVTVTTQKGQTWVVPITVPPRRWITEVDVSMLLQSGNSPLYLYLRSTMVGRREQSTIHAEPPVLNLPQIRSLARLLRQSTEESALEAYFKSRGACSYWQTASIRHDAGIHACKIWFDAAYRLATLPERPYRMDPGARKAMEDYEELASGDRGFAARYRRVTRVGYVEQMLRQIDAIEFGDASLVKQLIDSRRYDLATLLNDHLLGRWEKSPPSLRAEISRLQGVTEALLLSNRSYLASLASHRN